MLNLNSNWGKFSCVVIFLVSIISGYRVDAQSFSSSNLSGVNLTNPTTLQFGPDGRLYVAQQDGTIFAYTIQKNGPNDYQVSSTETIQLVKQITNHNDDGSVNASETDRQVTGLLTTGTVTNPVLYVSSSDPRIGGGEGGGIGDVNLDTNSGVISKLTWNGSSWEKVDVVKGLPRSEENHAVNGMQLDENTNTLYLAMGGNTNAGSPSVNFTYITEYALAAAVLSIDLDDIENNFGGSYDLPTLDDPTRANTGPGGSDIGDPFGGNDGLNQAKIVIGGPVQVYAPGFRNIYDLVLTKSPGVENRLYTIDNGPNGGWGGHPENEGTANVTNNYVPGEPGSQGPGPNDAQVNNLDNLHLVSAPGFGPIYGGHPNPIRANPSGAGLYRRDDSNQEFFELNPTVDWPPVPVSLANPIEGDYQNPGVDDGALFTWGSSTNGMAEYTAINFFGGDMTGDLLAASFDGNIYRIELSANGQATTNVSVFASGFGSTPLDVTAQGTGDIFEGTVWAVTYVAETVTVFEPDTPADDGWTIEASSNNPTERHENAYVEAGGLFYLIGGRGNKPLDIYDPVTQSWSTGTAPPFEMHHFQAVSFQGDIYVVGGFTGAFPDETPLTNIYIYDPDTDSWSTGPAIPANRQRGSGGVVVYNDKIYLVGGIQNGHIDGWVPWLDEFDPVTNTWTPLADAPRSRDHFQAAVVGNNLYAVGGRRTNEITLFTPTIPEIDVYDFLTGTWSTLPGSANIPTERAGATTVAINGTIIVIGGETGPQDTAHNETEALDPGSNVWTTLDPLNTGRHGTQAIPYLGKVYVAAGSANRGGGPELDSQEFLSFATGCSGDPNDFTIDDDGDGYSNGDETLNGTDPCSSASRPQDNDSDFISDLLDDDDDNDGLLDTEDKFALDIQNGEDTSLPVDYPFLNGNPGFGLFGLGYTGLMTNGTTDYLQLFDADDPGLIMGGASGVATIPASAGDALTNDQEYAFQFGVSVTSSTSPFTVRSALEGTPFFNGNFQDQSQGIYIGNGDQDNYLKLVLAANNGNGAFQILSENNGAQVENTIIPVTNILNESEIILYLKIDPSSGTVQPQYAAGSSPGSIIDLGAPISLTGTLLNVLQGSDAIAAGLIATSGSAPSFQASWDFIEIDPDPVFQAVYKVNSGGPSFIFNGENWQADQFNDADATYSDPIAIANTTNDELYQTEANSSTGGFTYDFPVTDGDYSVNLHFAELFHGIQNGNGIGARVFNVDVENGQGVLNNYDIFEQAGAAATAVVESFTDINVTDGSLTIIFTSTTDRAKSSGIEVFGLVAAEAPVTFNPGNQLINPGVATSFQVFASDPNPADLLTFSATGLPAGLTLDPSTGIVSGTVTDPAADYNVSVRATDNFGLFSEVTFTISVNNFQVLHRINSGGPAFTFNSEIWEADQFTTGGQSFTNVIPIANTSNDELYQTEGFDNSGSFSYNVPVPVSGTYAVRLHFAEIFHGVENSNGVGARIFNMEIEGAQAQLTNYDIIAEAGAPATAISAAFSGIQVTDGILNIDFLASVDNAKLSGLEIFNVQGPQAPPMMINPESQIFSAGESVSLQLNAIDPNIGDVLTFTATGLPGSLSVDSSTGLITGTVGDPDGDYEITVTATDGGGLFDEETFTLSIGTFTEISRINTGGPAFSFNGINWLADQFGDAGNSFNNAIAIEATSNDELYQTEAFDTGGSFTYNVPVPTNGIYALRLHFAEIFHGVEQAGGVGSRVFEVDVEGQASLNSYDIIQKTGAPATAITAGFNNVNVSDGNLTISFSNTVDNAKISGIEVFAVVVPPLPPVVTSPSNQFFNVGDEVSIQVNASDPNAGDPLTYSATGLPGTLTIDPVSGLISGTVNDVLSDYNVLIRATDGGGLFGEASFNIAIGVFSPIIRINSGGPAFTEGAGSPTAFQEQNGLFVVEAESAPIANNWASGSDGSVSYYEATADNFSNPDGGGILNYELEVSTPGIYRFEWRSQINQGTSTSESNDNWLKFPNTSDVVFFGYQGTVTSEAQLDADLQSETNIVFPIGSGLEGPSTTPIGAGGDGYFKVFINTLNSWPWLSVTSDGDAHNIYVKFVNPGIYTMQISNRSTGHAIDRFALYKIDTYGDNLDDNVLTNAPESPTGGSGSGIQWSADQFNDGSGAFTNTIPIAATSNDLLYHSERFDSGGSFSYEIPVPSDGLYAARLHFAEIFHGVENTGGIGSRIINIDVESGQALVNNFDIISHVGAPATATKMGINNINVTDGFFSITLNASVDNPKISGVELFAVQVSPVAPVVVNPGDQFFNDGEQVNIQISASDPNAGDVITYSASGLPVGLTIDPATGLISGVISGAAGDNSVTVTASDDGGLSSDQTFIINQGTYIPVIRINSGGPAYTFNAEDWQADQFTDGTGEFTNAVPIDATLNDQLYQTERFDLSGTFSYNIPVPTAGEYAVRIHVAEIFHGVENTNGVGARVFDLDVESGQGQSNSIDIINLVGAPATAAIIAFNSINVADGFLTIDFTSTIDNPKVSGIELFSAPAAPAPPSVVNPGDQFYSQGESVSIQINANDPNVGDVLTYSASGLPAGISIDPVTGLISGTAAGPFGDSQVTVTVSDSGGLSGDVIFNINVGKYAALFRINSGGPAFTFNADDWQADQFNDGSGAFGNVIPIAATANDQLYQSERFDAGGTFSYNIPVPAGDYAMRLHFAEIFHGIENTLGAGARVFNVDVENGQALLSNFDIIAQVGAPATAMAVSFNNVNVSDGFLTISFTNVVDNPKISGIEVFEIEAIVPPVLDLIGDQMVDEGAALDVNINASDDTSPPVLTVTGLPAFATFTDNGDGTAVLALAPGFQDSGSYDITVTATDDDGLTDSEDLTITVNEVNQPPDLLAIGNQEVPEGSTLDIPISASDPDSEIPQITALGLPSFATFVDNGDGTATLTLTPGFTDVGVYSVNIVATDAGGLTDEETISITVIDVNAAPVLAAIGDQTVPEGDLLDLVVTADDPDGETPVLTVVGLPGFITFTDNGDGTALLSIAPGFTDVGVYQITVVATDALGVTDEETIQITITEVNVAPELAMIPDQTLEEASTITIDVAATDADNEIPAITVTGLQPFMSFTDNGDGTGVITISPDINEFGNFVVTVVATDAAGLTDEQQVNISVTEITRDPEWSVNGQVENANCLNEAGSIILDVSGGFGTIEYAWSNGSTDKDLTDLESGVYTVTITDQKGNQTSEMFTVNIQPGPQKPTISQDGNFLVSSEALSYQWNYNGEEIEGATGQSLELTLSGEYSVTIGDDLGCTVMSDPFSVEFDTSELNVFPVPSHGELNVEIILKEGEVISLTLIDAMGRQTPMGVYNLSAGRHQITLNFNDSFANGVYMLLNNGQSFSSNLTRIVLVR